VAFEDGTNAVTTEGFRNTWSLAAGGDYAVTEAATVRAGLQYEQSPARDAYRSTRIPDTNRLWGGIGASYAFGAQWALDVSYMHLFAKSGPINRDNEFAALGTSVHTIATTKTSSNVLGLGLRAYF
jgi:long-chain fatty acid transport protein